MATWNKPSVLVWVTQEAHLWALARAKLAVVVVLSSLCRSTCSLTSCKRSGPSRGLVHSSLSLAVIAEMCLTWHTFWGYQQELAGFLIWAKIILGRLNLSYFLSSVLWGKLYAQKFFFLCIFILFRMTLYWQASVKGPYCYWELDPLIWMKN